MQETGQAILGFQAPAKLNLFLHVTGRRPDGYHTLQTVLQLIGWCDELDFALREDGAVVRVNELPGIPAETDLCVRAARLLQQESGTRLGAAITVRKTLPAGGGLGGGSSDAATTLLALNRLWRTGLARAELMRLGLQLGADVPFFLFGENAFAEGVGEALQPVALPPRHFLVISPPVQSATAAVFQDPALTRNTETVRISDFIAQADLFSFGRNDMETVAGAKYAEISQALDWLRKQAYPARMSGSGSCVFASFAKQEQAQEAAGRAAQDLPQGWRAVAAPGLGRHPLADFV